MVIGFQGFQWMWDVETTWVPAISDSKEIAVSLANTLADRVDTSTFPFYGAYMFPEEVKPSRIVVSCPEEGGGDGI